MLEIVYAENIEQFLWETYLKIVNCICLCVQMKKKNYLFLGVCLFVDYWKKKKHMELKLAKLKFHITRNSSLGSLSTIEEKKDSNTLKFCIYKELELGKIEYCVAWSSRLPSSSSMWHFFNKKIHISTSFFMKLECLKLDL